MSPADTEHNNTIIKHYITGKQWQYMDMDNIAEFSSERV